MFQYFNASLDYLEMGKSYIPSWEIWQARLAHAGKAKPLANPSVFAKI